MSDQAELENAKYIAVYCTTGMTGYPTKRCILGHSLDHLAEWSYLEEPISKKGGEITVFKVSPVSRTEYLSSVKKYKELKEEEYIKEKRSKLICELNDLYDKDQNWDNHEAEKGK